MLVRMIFQRVIALVGCCGTKGGKLGVLSNEAKVAAVGVYGADLGASAVGKAV